MNDPPCQPPARLVIISNDGGDTSCKISAVLHCRYAEEGIEPKC